MSGNLSKDHQVTVDEVLTYISQTVHDLVCCQHKRGGVSKRLYAVYNIATGACHFLVNEKRYDVLREAVDAYNTVTS